MGKNADTVKGIYDALARGDAAAVLGALDPDVEWREAESFLYADRNPYIGPEAVGEGVFQRITGAVEDLAVVPGNIIDGGDTVAVEGRYRGRMGATGTAVDAQFVHVWEFGDGKVVRFQQYTDTKQWAEAAGA